MYIEWLTFYNISVGPPNITCIEHNRIFCEGESVSSSCTATNDIDSNETLQVQWYNSSGILVKSIEPYVIIHNNILVSGKVQSVLSFNPANTSHGGSYTFRASNHPQSYVEAKVNLTVECKLCFI